MDLHSKKVMHKIIWKKEQCLEIIEYILSLLTFPTDAIDKLEENAIKSTNGLNVDDIKKELNKDIPSYINKLKQYNTSITVEAVRLFLKYKKTPKTITSVFKNTTLAWIYSVHKLMKKINKLRDETIPEILNILNNVNKQSKTPTLIWDTEKTKKYMYIVKNNKNNLYQQTQGGQHKQVISDDFINNYLPTTLENFLPGYSKQQAYRYIKGQKIPLMTPDAIAKIKTIVKQQAPIIKTTTFPAPLR